MSNTQLIKKDCTTGEYGNIFPVTTIDSVIIPESDKSLRERLESDNHFYLPYIGNLKSATRLQVPMNLRRKGLWITYETCNGKVITEWYNGDDFSDESWGSNNNWIKYINEALLEDLIENLLAWYKA